MVPPHRSPSDQISDFELNSQWIGFVGEIEKPETMVFLPSNIGGSCKFSHHPIL